MSQKRILTTGLAGLLGSPYKGRLHCKCDGFLITGGRLAIHCPF